MSGLPLSLGGASDQVSAAANFNRIKINLETEHGKCGFEVNDQGRYVVPIKGNVNQLTTAVCNNLKDLPQLLATGGTVMAVCYALYKLECWADNFSPESLAFEVEVKPAKLATIRRQLTKGRFAESLQDEVDDIIKEHAELAHIKKFKILSAKEVSMGETVKQSGSVFNAENVNVDHGAVMSSNINIGGVVGAQNPFQQSHPPLDMPSRVNLSGVTVNHGAVGSTNVNIDTKKTEWSSQRPIIFVRSCRRIIKATDTCQITYETNGLSNKSITGSKLTPVIKKKIHKVLFYNYKFVNFYMFNFLSDRNISIES